MSLINQELTITSPGMDDTLDIHPRAGTACDAFIDKHKFYLETQAAGFTYKICGRCGTVRIKERHGD